MKRLLTIQQNNNIRIEKVLGLLLLVGAILFNLWLYRLEPSTKIDPNDNAFQFALVDRTNQIWDFVAKNCSKNLFFPVCHFSYLVDHWVPNWNEGYNLPYYYGHLPQILIVGSWRLLNVTIQQFGNLTISLFQYYHWVIYLLLSFFPLSIFLALRLVGLPWLTAGIGALLATQISTDGLYGLDPPSFLWRGYGLSSQLFAMVFLPLAIAYSYRWLTDNQSAEGGGRQFLRELAFRSIFFRDDRSAAERHLARRESNLSDRLLPNRASRKNSSADSVHLSSFWPAVFFLFATTAGHLGIGMMAMLSLLPLAMAPLLFSLLQSPSQFSNLAIQQLLKLAVLTGTTIFFLSYWIIPIFLNDNYHSISFWDPVWKFNSYGAKETMIRFLNGDLFDFGRLPIFTILVAIGFFTSLVGDAGRRVFLESATPAADGEEDGMERGLAEASIKRVPTSASASVAPSYFPFTLLFIFWLVLYFGRTTWGGLVDLLPGMKEFHLSRFIVGLHLAGLFLAPIGVQWILQQFNNLAVQQFPRIAKLLNCCLAMVIAAILTALVYPQTISYNGLNNKLIVQANANFDKVRSDTDELFATLRSLGEGGPPGRIYAGRAGWGRNFRLAETSYYMHLSTYGLPTVMWMPETWSPNADTEQYFSENRLADYNLYNIRYVLTPPTPPAGAPYPFWKLSQETASWKLYVVPTNGYVDVGVRPAVVAADKRSFLNVVRLWIQSDNHVKGLFPELTFAKDYPKKTGLPNFRMIDEATYVVPDGSVHNLFKEPPVYLPSSDKTLQQLNNPPAGRADVAVLSQSQDSDMIFKATVNIGKDCTECLVILKQTFHPGWRATLDGKPVTTLTVFPFFVAISLNQEGRHEIIFSYQPSRLKVALFVIELVTIIVMVMVRVTAQILRD